MSSIDDSSVLDDFWLFIASFLNISNFPRPPLEPNLRWSLAFAKHALAATPKKCRLFPLSSVCADSQSKLFCDSQSRYHMVWLLDNTSLATTFKSFSQWTTPRLCVAFDKRQTEANAESIKAARERRAAARLRGLLKTATCSPLMCSTCGRLVDKVPSESNSSRLNPQIWISFLD
jgi:hypothetical protein